MFYKDFITELCNSWDSFLNLSFPFVGDRFTVLEKGSRLGGSPEATGHLSLATLLKKHAPVYQGMTGFIQQAIECLFSTIL